MNDHLFKSLKCLMVCHFVSSLAYSLESITPDSLRILEIEDNRPKDCNSVSEINEWTIDPAEKSNLSNSDKTKIKGELFHFKQGMCLFYLEEGKDNRKLDLMQAIHALTAAQNAGLPPVHQSHAALIQGLSHCHLSRLLYPTGLENQNATLFCLERRMGMSALSSVDFSLSFAYYSSGGLTSLIDDMTKCFGSAESPAEAPFSNAKELLDLCSTSNLSEQDINDAVDEVIKVDIVPRYLNSASAPLAAMIQRKKDRAQSVFASSRQAMTEISTTAEDLTSSHSNINEKVTTADALATNILNSYKSAFSIIGMLKDALDTWKNTMLVDPENVNRDIGEEIKSAKENINIKSGNSLAGRSKLSSIKEDVEQAYQLQLAKKLVNQRLCKLYFCDVRRKSNEDIVNGGSMCGLNSYRQNNRLCDNNPVLSFTSTKTSDTEGTSSSLSVFQFCQRFLDAADLKYITSEGDAKAIKPIFTLSTKDSLACLEGF